MNMNNEKGRGEWTTIECMSMKLDGRWRNRGVHEVEGSKQGNRRPKVVYGTRQWTKTCFHILNDNKALYIVNGNWWTVWVVFPYKWQDSSQHTQISFSATNGLLDSLKVLMLICHCLLFSRCPFTRLRELVPPVKVWLFIASTTTKNTYKDTTQKLCPCFN